MTAIGRKIKTGSQAHNSTITFSKRTGSVASILQTKVVTKRATVVRKLIMIADFIGGGVAGRGHKFGFTYQLAKNLQAALTHFHTEIDRSPDLDYRRFQSDLKFKF